MGHGRAAGSRRGPLRRTLVGRQRIRRAPDRRKTPRGARWRVRRDHHLRSGRSLLCSDEMGKEVHVVNRDPIHVTAPVLEKVAEHARASYANDEEACGYLTGPEETPLLCDEATALQNLANRYHAVDPETYPRTGR